MKQRLFTGWNFRRIIYLLAGGTIILQSAITREWIGILIGGSFSSMGLFALGCAAGNCVVPHDFKTNEIDKKLKSPNFEEIK